MRHYVGWALPGGRGLAGGSCGGSDGASRTATSAGQRGASVGSTGAGAEIWSDGRITFPRGAAATTGAVVVHVPAKGDGNGLPCPVRAGGIHFVMASGSDGSFAHPWATIPKAKNAIPPGDVAYLGTHASDAVSPSKLDGSSPYECALGRSFNDGSNSLDIGADERTL